MTKQTTTTENTMTRIEQIEEMELDISETSSCIGEAMAERVYFDPTAGDKIPGLANYVAELDLAVELADESLGFWRVRDLPDTWNDRYNTTILPF